MIYKDNGIVELAIDDFGTTKAKSGYHDNNVVIVQDIKKMSNKAPLRANAYTLVACGHGSCHVELGGKSYDLTPGCMLFCVPNVIIDHMSASDDFTGSVICLTATIVQTLLGANMSVWNRVLYVARKVMFKVDYSNIESVMGYANQLERKMNDDANPFKTEIVMSVLRAILFELCALMLSYCRSDEANANNQAELLFNRFIDILSAERVKKQPVYYYADQLCISPKYLTVVCKQMSGRTASDWIEEYLADDIRFYLRSTSKPMKEVCDILNFPNLSFFGKYVKTHFGLTPSEFRKAVSVDAPRKHSAAN